MLSLNSFELKSINFKDSLKILGGVSHVICSESTGESTQTGGYTTFDKSFTKYNDSGQFMTGWSELTDEHTQH
jgi:hypothetical protein